MTRTIMKAEAVHPGDEATSYLFDNWFDPIEAGLRERVRGFLETRCSRPSWKRCLPVPVMAGSRRRAVMRPPVSPATATAAGRAR